MAQELFIPKLGQTVEEVTLIKWQVADGVKVEQGQEILEVETDKATFPVEANAKGTIHLGPYKEGDVLPVLTVVAIIGKPEDKFEPKASTPLPVPAPAAAGETAAEVQPQAIVDTTTGAEGARRFASPRARMLAAEKGVDLARVTPSGYGGIRVTERDVAAYLDQAPRLTPLAQRMAAGTGADLRGVTGTGPGGRIGKNDVAKATRLAAPENPPAPPSAEADVVERIPLKGIRAIIAERMAASVHTTARVTLVSEADATEFVAARERLKARMAADWGFDPGYNDLLAKIVAAALRKFPYMNARLTADAIELLRPVNIGMAVDTERGLLVPVIRDADRKSLRQFAVEFRELVERARVGRSLPDDLSGGTFTITNLGMYGVDAFTPVINLPEAAILGVGRIAPKVVPYQGEIAIRKMWTLSLVFDHRLVDGAPAARFLQSIKELIEEPALWISM